MPLAISKSDRPIVRRANFAVAEAIRDGIMNGDLAPGEVILEEEIAGALGVSRTPVREALLLLAGEQLVDLGKSRGQRASVRKLTTDELSEIYALREFLEGYAARRAATRITDADLRILEESCDRMEAVGAGAVSELIEENRIFHGTILRVANSERLTFIAGTLLQIPLAYKQDFWNDRDCLISDVRGHREIVDALRHRDPEAAAATMGTHLVDVGGLAIGKLEHKALESFIA